MAHGYPGMSNGSVSSSRPTLLGGALSAWRQRGLLFQLVRQDVAGRYRGSMGGIVWALVQPLLMLTVYTTVFSVFLKARWAGTEKSLEFAVILFAGLIVFNFFAESLNRAPQLIVGNPNYVKKVIFPLEILPWIAVGSALFHTAVALVAWALFYFAIHGHLQWTLIFLPLLLAPLVLFVVGFCWFLSSVGVYIRDTAQVIGIITQLMMFLSPIFYSVDVLPREYQPLLLLNPLSFEVEQMRAVMIYGSLPDFKGLAAYTLCGALTALAGLWWFQKTRDGFADVM